MKDYQFIKGKEIKNFIKPSKKLVMAMPGEIVGESNSIRGLICLLIPQYADAEDELDDWHMRLKYARAEAMRSLEKDIDVIVYDESKGSVISNNYGVSEDDPDYVYDVAENKDVERIDIGTEEAFILSLIKLKSIAVMERADSSIFNKSEYIEENKGKYFNINA